MSDASPSPPPAPSHPDREPRPNWTEVVSAVSSILTLIVTLGGLLGLYLQFKAYNDAIDEESERRVRDAYARLYTMDMDVWKFVGQTPIVEEALTNDKDGAVLRKMSADERARFDATCQLLGDVFEYYIFIEPDLKGKDWAIQNNCWLGYISLIYKQSAGFRAYVKATESEWTTTFVDRLAEITVLP